MARREYGGTLADFTADRAGVVRGRRDLYAWAARTGPARLVDLVAVSGTIRPDAGGQHLLTDATGAIDLLGPDGYDGEGMWVSADPDPAAARYWLRALLGGNTGGEGAPPVAGGLEHVQVAPSASWVITHTLARRPVVAVYIDGELVEADVTATTTSVNVAFPYPVAGTAVLA